LVIFEQNSPKVWSIICNGYEPKTLILGGASTVTNKYFIIARFIERVSEQCLGFDKWFMGWLEDCYDEEKRPETIVDSIHTIKEFCNLYLQQRNVDYSSFVDETKVKKNSIFFTAIEIEKIIKLSSYLKVYSIVSNSEDFKLGQKLHKEVYNKIASDMIDTEIIKKIYDVVKTKTFRYNMTDKYMWDYIKNVQCKDIGIHVVEIFNFIMNHILVLCEEDKNPITYFVGVIDESVKWFLRSVYKGSIVYDDSISTEDIQGINSDNLKTYSYNDTLGRLKQIAHGRINELVQKQSTMTMDSVSDKVLIEFNDRLATIEFISPLCETLVFPILSKITGIPYMHFKTLSPEHSVILSVYVQELLKKVFGAEYKNLFTLLNFYPLKSPSIATTYKIKSIHEYLNTQTKDSFFKLDARKVQYDLLCQFVGRISRVDFCNILDGRKLGGIPLSKIESDVIKFYSEFFSGHLEDKFKEMEKLLNADF